MSAHTPGPWHAVKTLKDGWFIVDRPDSLGHNVLYGLHEAQLEANARLLAASPRLLAALKALVDVLNDDLDSEQCAAWDAAVAAIDNAEGGRSTDNGAPVQPEGLV